MGGPVDFIRGSSVKVYVALVLVGLLCLFTTWKWRTAEATLLAAQELSHQELSALLSENGRLTDEVTRLRVDLEHAKTWPYIMLSDSDIARMKAQGLEDPITNLTNSLSEQTDLVPFQPHGGRTRVGPFLISSGWVVAGVGDGHKAILAILGYEVQDGQIRWWVKAAEPDGPPPEHDTLP